MKISNKLILITDRDARYTKWKMAVQRSLGWASTKKSITMTGLKRKNSILSSSDTMTPPDSRQNSLDKYVPIDKPPTDEGVDNSIEELIQYSARKFSVFVPLSPEDEHTILDDAEYFMNKKECDYGMCLCCQSKKKLHTDWKTIEEIIENDPEIIFDCDDNPIVVEPKNDHMYEPTPVIGNSMKKRSQLENIPIMFKNICDKLTDTSLT